MRPRPGPTENPQAVGTMATGPSRSGANSRSALALLGRRQSRLRLGATRIVHPAFPPARPARWVGSHARSLPLGFSYPRRRPFLWKPMRSVRPASPFECGRLAPQGRPIPLALSPEFPFRHSPPACGSRALPRSGPSDHESPMRTSVLPSLFHVGHPPRLRANFPSIPVLSSTNRGVRGRPRRPGCSPRVRGTARVQEIASLIIAPRVPAAGELARSTNVPSLWRPSGPPRPCPPRLDRLRGRTPCWLPP